MSYLGKTDSYEVEVVENPVESIEITQAPTKTAYTENLDGYWSSFWDKETGKEVPYYHYDIYNLSGFEMTIYYKDGSSTTYSYNEFGDVYFNGYWIEFIHNQFGNPS